MVFTHLPSNILLMLVPFAPNLAVAIALLLARSALSQMDVPTRSSYVMAVVTPEERPAAASITAVPKTFAWAAGSLISGYLLTLVELWLAAVDRRRHEGRLRHPAADQISEGPPARGAGRRDRGWERRRAGRLVGIVEAGLRGLPRGTCPMRRFV